MLILIYVVKMVRKIIDSLVVFKSLMVFLIQVLTAMVNFKYKGSIKLNKDR